MHPENKRANILAINSVEALKYLTLKDTEGGLTLEEIDHIFKLCDAIWFHSGDRNQPHVATRGGGCSAGYVDALRVLIYTNICRMFARDLHKKLIQAFPSAVDWAIGSAHAAATFSHSVACLYPGAKHDFTEKSPDGRQLWQRFQIQPHEIVLQIEETITALTTLKLVREGIREGNFSPVNFAPVVGTLVHRSGIYEFESAPIIYLRHYDIETWSQDECYLCKMGSERLEDPKKNWAKLTGKY
ncbi:MAG: hypothetical protein Q7R99_02880 [bacterium]|nr:hypothetical protein [bacterium]